MKIRPLIITIALLSAALPAYAQFGNLLQNIKGTIDAATSPSGTTKSAPTKALGSDNTSDSYEPCIQKEETYFRCTIKGKALGFCSNFASDAPSVDFIMGKRDKNGISEYSNPVYEGAKDRILVAQQSQGKATLTTVSIKDYKDKNITYSVTECQGMECNPDKNTWLTITKGQTEMAGGGFCDPGSSTGFNFPFSEDKKGNLTLKIKEYFSLQKKPYGSAATTNKSWSE